MSSKFVGPRVRFKSPAVCKKSPPPIAAITFPTTTLSAWFEFDGTTHTGNPIQISQTITLIYSMAIAHEWRGLIQIDTYSVSFLQTWNEGANTWQIDLRGNSPILGIYQSRAFAWQPRYLDPFDSGYLPLNVNIGTGNSAGRVLL